MILSMCNLAALAVLVWRLIDCGKTYSRALQIAWNLIIFDNPSEEECGICRNIDWAPVLRKTWWINLLLFCACWIFQPSVSLTISLLLAGIFHFCWYYYCKDCLQESFDQVYHLNSNWGIIYEEIKEGSILKARSLAELDLRKKNLLVLAVQREGQILPFPKGLEMLGAGDRVVMFGDLNAYRGLGG